MILWRMLATDLLKVVALTAAVLVVFIAFAAAFRPLTEGRLSPQQTLKFMGLALLPMLQFALPFAAGFGATLSYHRFASENEAVAAMSGGVSHRSLLAPAAISGLALSLFLGSLTLEVIPRFLRSMQLLLGADIARLIVTNIESGRSVRLPDGVIVHADAIQRRPAEPGSRASDHFVMEGVLAVKTDKNLGIERWVAAQRAGVWLFDQDAAPPSGLVVIRLVDAESSGEIEGGAGKIDLRITPPSAFGDSTKFYPTRDLARLRDEPQRIPWVEARRRTLADTLESRRLERDVRDATRAAGRVLLEGPDGETVAIRAVDLHDDAGRWRLVPPPGKPIELVWRLAGGRTRLQTAERAYLSPTDTAGARTSFAVAAGQHPADAGPTLTLELENLATQDAASEAAGAAVLPRRSFGGLMPAGDRQASLTASAPARLLTVADQSPADKPVADAAAELRSILGTLAREVASQHHSRAAIAVSCLVMVLAGAVGGLRLRDSRPLLVYAWSFFPSLLAILTIHSGQSVMVDDMLAGVLVLWGGVAALALFVLFDYAQLRKH